MAEDERTNDETADAGLGSRSGERIDGEASAEGGGGETSGVEVRGSGDPASLGEGSERGGRAGDWDPGQHSGEGGELY
jgi:hypothetical protein